MTACRRITRMHRRSSRFPAAPSWISPREISTVLGVAQGRDLSVNCIIRLLAGHPTIRGQSVEADQAAINQTITCLVYRLLESPVTVISLRKTTRHMLTVRHTLCIMNNVCLSIDDNFYAPCSALEASLMRCDISEVMSVLQEH